MIFEFPDAPKPLVELSTLEDADIRDASQSELSQIRTYLNSSLFAFAWVICGFRDIIPSLHGELCAYIEKWGQPDHFRIMTQISREFFKTSVGTLANALWQISHEPHLPVAIFNERQDNSQKWLRSIRNIVSNNPIYQELYKDLLPPGIHHADTRSMPRHWKWNDNALDFDGRQLGDPEASISAHGIESATVGGHWPKMILDDLISLKHKLSEVEMERAREWIRGHIYLMRPAEKGLVYVNCTPRTYNDIYVDLLRDFNYKLYRRAALELPDGTASIAGESIFPQKLTTSELRSMAERDRFTFNAQMMCIPAPGREQSFDPSWRRYCHADPSNPNPIITIDDNSYDPTILPDEDGEPAPRTIPFEYLNIAGILDPAPTERRDVRAAPTARNGLIVEAVDPWSRRYILQAEGLRADPYDIVQRLFDLSREWGFDTWYIEEVTFSAIYRHWIQREQLPGGSREGEYLRVQTLQPGRSRLLRDAKGKLLGATNKDKRITSKIPGWRSGHYYLNGPRSAQLEQELLEYPNSTTRDLLDALGYDHFIQPLTSPRQRALQEAQQWDRQREQDPVTGYSITMRPAQ